MQSHICIDFPPTYSVLFFTSYCIRLDGQPGSHRHRLSAYKYSGNSVSAIIVYIRRLFFKFETTDAK